jgi:hypothetical protein
VGADGRRTIQKINLTRGWRTRSIAVVLPRQETEKQAKVVTFSDNKSDQSCGRLREHCNRDIELRANPPLKNGQRE